MQCCGGQLFSCRFPDTTTALVDLSREMPLKFHTAAWQPFKPATATFTIVYIYHQSSDVKLAFLRGLYSIFLAPKYKMSHGTVLNAIDIQAIE